MNQGVMGISYIQLTRVLLLLVSTTPLVVSSHLIESHVIPRTLSLYVLTASALMTALGAYVTGACALRITRSHILLGVLFLVGACATLFAPDPFLSVFSTPDRMEGLVLWFMLIVYAFLLSHFFDASWWRTWFILNVCIGSMIALFGLSQYGGSFVTTDTEGRIDIFFGNPVFYGAYMLCIAVLTTCIFFSLRTTVGRLGAGALMCLSYTALILSGTRSVMLGVCGGIIVGLLCYAYTSPKRLRAFFSVGVVSLVLVLGIGGLFALQGAGVLKSDILDRFRALGEGDIRTQARYYHYTAALQGIKESPVLGYGFEGYTTVFERFVAPRYYGDTLSSTPEPWSDRAHNEYLDLAVSMGVPGALIFVGLLLYTGICLFRTLSRDRMTHTILLGALTAYSIHIFFNFSVLVDLLFLFAFIAYGAQRDSAIYHSVPKAHTGVVRTAILVSGFVFLIGTYTVVGNRASFAYGMKQLHDREQAGTYARLVGAHEFGTGAYIDASYAREDALVTSAYYGAKTENEAKRQEALLRIKELETHARTTGVLTPRDFYYYGMSYMSLGAYGDARRVLEEGRKIAPNRLHILNALSLTLEKSGMPDEARAVAERSYTLEPTYNESNLRYVSALIVSNNATSADEVLMKEYGTRDVLSPELIRAYTEVGQYDRAVSLLRSNLEKNPQNASYWKLLLDVYETEGDTKAYRETKARMEKILTD